MAEKKQQKLYKYIGNHPRGENGKTVRYGDLVNLDHLKEADIKLLLTLGYYREV